MNPVTGRSRVVIEDVTPQIECGKFAVKRIVGETIEVRAAIFGDGHDHVAARLLYKPEHEQEWRTAPMHALGNDIWSGGFCVDEIGLWHFTVQGWIDHFDTWSSDLEKRIDAQSDALADNSETSEDDRKRATEIQEQLRKDIALAFRTGASLVDRAGADATGEDAKKLKSLAATLRAYAEKPSARYENPLTPELIKITERYPDLSYATTYEKQLPIRVDRERARFSSWYEFFPRSAGTEGKHGTLRDAAALIPQIADAGFDVIYFPPIHPVGRAFRKGKNNSVVAEADDVGSPWAIGASEGGHTDILPELGTLTDFDFLLGTAKRCGVEIAMDIAFQCAPDHPWVLNHPEWFSIRPDGSIQYAENPPKKYQDIYPLNFESKDWNNLWRELLHVFLFWARRGVRIFRVDNPHTKALPFWEWCIREVQKQFPDVIFLAEAFTRPHVMYGLAKRGFTQSYTYFTWREMAGEIREYLTEITQPPVSDFFRPNFWPNTPDILPGSLKTGLRASFQMRAVLAATLCSNWGVYGPAFELMEHMPAKPGSEEYLNSEKYQVRVWSRENTNSLLPFLKTLNQTRHEHVALQSNDTLRFHGTDNEQLLCYSKRSGDDVVLMVVNLDPRTTQSGWTQLDMQALGLHENEPYEVHDALTSEVYRWSGPYNFVLLNPEKMPAHVLHVRQIASQR